MPNITTDSLKAIHSGGPTPWIRIRGTDSANPVLLLMQKTA
jgi:hypothetical protein